MTLLVAIVSCSNFSLAPVIQSTTELNALVRVSRLATRASTATAISVNGLVSRAFVSPFVATVAALVAVVSATVAAVFSFLAAESATVAVVAATCLVLNRDNTSPPSWYAIFTLSMES